MIKEYEMTYDWEVIADQKQLEEEFLREYAELKRLEELDSDIYPED